MGRQELRELLAQVGLAVSEDQLGLVVVVELVGLLVPPVPEVSVARQV